MTIEPRSAAPQGAAPAPVTTGPGARSAAAPAVHQSFSSLVDQLSDAAPAGRPDPARASSRGDGRPPAALSQRGGGSTAPHPATRSAVPRTPSDGVGLESGTASGSDETGRVPVDAAAMLAGPAADPPIALPAWVWALTDPGASAAPDATAMAGTDPEEAEQNAIAGSQTIGASTPTPVRGPWGRTDSFTAGQTQSNAVQDPARPDGTGLPAGAGLPADAALPGNAQSASNAEPTGRRGEIGMPADRTATDDPRVADSSEAGRNATTAAGSVFGARPGPVRSGQPGAPSSDKLSPADAARAADLPESGAGHAAAPLASALAYRPGRVGHAPHSGLLPEGLPTGAGDRSVSNAPAVPGDADPTSPQTIPADLSGSGRPADPSALDRAARLAALFGATPPAAARSEGAASQAAPLPAPPATSVTAADAAAAFDHRKNPSGQSFSDRARDDAQMSGERAINAEAEAALRVEHGAPAGTRLVEVAGTGGLQAAAPASAPATASIGAPVAVPDEGSLRHQIVQGIKFQWRDGVGDVKLTLHPEYLGEMNISLRVDQGGVTAQLSAESASVRAWIAANEPLLRQGLAEQGLTLSRLVVTDQAPEQAPERESRRHAPQQETPKPPPPPRPDAATFEIVL